MIKIWKYNFALGRHVFNRKPGPVLHVGLDPTGAPSIWVAANVNELDIQTEIVTVGTGFEPPGDAGIVHRGSFVQGPFVWHIYEKLG